MDQNSQVPTEPQPVEPTPQPAAAPYQATVVDPGHGLGIASFIVSLLGAGLIGLILGIIGNNKSKKAGQKNGFALAGIIIGIVNIVVSTLFFIVIVYGAVGLAARCSELGAGSHIVDGVTYECGTSSSSGY